MADTINPATIAATAEPEVINKVKETVAQPIESTEVEHKSYNDIIKGLITNGNKRYNDIRVRNVKSERMDSDYVRITFVVDKPIPAYVLQDDGTYKLDVSNNIFSSAYAISGMLKEYEDLAWLANEILGACDRAIDEDDDKPLGIINLLFNGSKIDVLSTHVEANKEYYNPFSTNKDAEAYISENNFFANNVIKITLGKTGKVASNRLMDKLLGF